MKKILVVTSMALGLSFTTACGGSDAPAKSAETTAQINPLADIPKCETWQGKVVSAALWKNGCVTGTTLNAAAPTTCKGGRVLYGNDWGWGYADAPAQARQAGAERVAPKDERTRCNG